MNRARLFDIFSDGRKEKRATFYAWIFPESGESDL